MSFGYFDKIYCLNQLSRPDRWQQALDEFLKHNIIEVEQFLCITADQPFQSFCLSQYAMLKKFLASDKNNLLILEDDVIIHEHSHLDEAIKELPHDWDILYLGANLFGQGGWPIPQKFSNHLSRIKHAWTSHAIAYNRKAAQYIVNHYPVETYAMYDNWLSENVLEKLNCFITNPMCAWQRPVKSDLWGIEVDYTGAFDAGNKLLTA